VIINLKRRHLLNFSKAMLMTATTLLFAANVDADSIRCGEYVIEDE